MGCRLRPGRSREPECFSNRGLTHQLQRIWPSNNHGREKSRCSSGAILRDRYQKVAPEFRPYEPQHLRKGDLKFHYRFRSHFGWFVILLTRFADGISPHFSDGSGMKEFGCRKSQLVITVSEAESTIRAAVRRSKNRQTKMAVVGNRVVAQFHSGVGPFEPSIAFRPTGSDRERRGDN